MEEILKNQDSLIALVDKENFRYIRLQNEHQLDLTISKAQVCFEKLTNIKLIMLDINERIAKLKLRAVKLLDHNYKVELERQRRIERQVMMDKHLEPVVNTKP